MSGGALVDGDAAAPVADPARHGGRGARAPGGDFLPSPGAPTRLALPSGEGVPVTSHYDPLLMKVIAAGPSRDEAIARLDTALKALVIEGVRTTVPCLRRVLAHADFRGGALHTQMVEQGALNG